MDAMAAWCGREGVVLKRVHHIFDERSWKMRKVRNVVLLEGVYCPGRDMFDKEGCDRACFFFWKEAWLERR